MCNSGFLWQNAARPLAALSGAVQQRVASAAGACHFQFYR